MLNQNTIESYEIEDILNPEININSEAESSDKFKIDNLDKANWASKKILQAQKRIEDREKLAKDYKDKIDHWLNNANSEDERTISFLQSMLYPYIENEISNKKTKTVKLLGTKVSIWSLPVKIDIVNIDLALSFCERNYPNLIIIKKDISKTEIKKLYQSGIAVPGVILSGGTQKLYVKEDF